MLNSKLKFAIVTLTIVVASTLLYAPLTNAIQSYECEQTPETSCVDEKDWVWWFLNNSEPVTVDGTVVALLRDMLVVNTGEGQTRIILPEEWIIDATITTKEGLFTNNYLDVGENVTVSALRANIISKEGLCIYFLLGYEVVDDSDVHAYATLPLNIET